MKTNRYTFSEVFGSLNEGQYAISVEGLDKDTMLSIDQEGWLYIVYPHREYKKYGINIRHGKDSDPTSSYEIRDINEDTKNLLDSLKFVE